MEQWFIFINFSIHEQNEVSKQSTYQRKSSIIKNLYQEKCWLLWETQWRQRKFRTRGSFASRRRKKKVSNPNIFPRGKTRISMVALCLSSPHFPWFAMNNVPIKNQAVDLLIRKRPSVENKFGKILPRETWSDNFSRPQPRSNCDSKSA